MFLSGYICVAKLFVVEKVFSFDFLANLTIEPSCRSLE